MGQIYSDDSTGKWVKFKPTLTPAVLSQKLTVLYAKAEAKIEAASKKRKDSKKDFELLARLKGQFPASLAGVMAGSISPAVGSRCTSRSRRMRLGKRSRHSE